jgi:acetyltransferase
MAADALEGSGLRPAVLGAKTVADLTAKLPPYARVGEFLDVSGDADPERYGAAVSAALLDPDVDAVITILTPQPRTRPIETAEALAAIAKASKPVLTAFMGGGEVWAAREKLVQAGLPEYSSPERAVAALRALYDYAAWQRRPPRIVTRFPVNRRRAERIIARQLRAGRLEIGELKAKEVLDAYDFNIPPGFLVLSADEAVEAAERLGFPVAMKAISPDIVRKSDVGGTRLGLTSPDEIRDAFDLMMLRLNRSVPAARLDGLYLEKMCPKGREVIIGMNRNPQFGPMLMFGLGGIFVEVMEDVAFHLAPITAEEARQMLMGTRSYALLKGSGTGTAVDLAGIATGLQRISQLVTDFPQIAQLEINPLIVGEVGTEPMVADARILLTQSGSRP